MEKADRLLTIAEAIDVSKISRASAYRLLKNKQLAAVKIGRATRIRQSDLERFMATLKPYAASVRETR